MGRKVDHHWRLYSINETSFGYVYAFAAFARIVAEHPNLWGLYGADAITYTNEITKTVQAFLPQILTRQRNNATEATLTIPNIHRSIPTDDQCKTAYDQALADDPGADGATKERYDTWKEDCIDLSKGAGIDMAHNWNQWFIMGLIELWKALGSHWYLNHPDAHYKDESLRGDLLRLVSRLHRNFVNRLKTVGNGADAHFVWNYNDGLPPGFRTHAEDTGHGALDMRGLGVLYDNLPKLSAAAAAAGEPIELNDTHLRRFANTFLKKIAAGFNLAEDVLGNAADPVDERNYACDGWMNLAVADVRVYHKCHNVSLRVVDGSQPYLSIGNHSALLMNKRWWRECSDGERRHLSCPSGTHGPGIDDVCVGGRWWIQDIWNCEPGGDGGGGDECCPGEFNDDGTCRIFKPPNGQCP